MEQSISKRNTLNSFASQEDSIAGQSLDGKFDPFQEFIYEGSMNRRRIGAVSVRFAIIVLRSH